MHRSLVTTLSCCLLLASVLACASASDPTPEPATESPMAEMIGIWTPTSANLKGTALPREILDQMRLTLGAGTYEAKVGESLDKGTVSLDLEATPPRMEITGVEGPNVGRTIPAIFSLEEGVLKICYALGSEEYPIEFAATTENGHYMVRYVRQ